MNDEFKQLVDKILDENRELFKDLAEAEDEEKRALYTRCVDQYLHLILLAIIKEYPRSSILDFTKEVQFVNLELLKEVLCERADTFRSKDSD